MLIISGSVASIRISLILAIIDLKCARMRSQNGLTRTHLDIIRLVIALVAMSWFYSKLLHERIHIHLCKGYF